jgi:hypothetical protein
MDQHHDAKVQQISSEQKEMSEKNMLGLKKSSSHVLNIWIQREILLKDFILYNYLTYCDYHPKTY